VATVRVQEAPFDVAAETAALTAGRTDIGALASFTGICRADDGLAAMTLEHYPAMTERAIAAIAAEAEARWPLTGCTVIHRVGRLAPGAPIVLVLTASAHRVAALEACAFLMDWLKTKAPFWKREEFAAGGARWVEARAEDEDAAAQWQTAQWQAAKWQGR
jgi:molybdopterin synthase catalytic subunit